MRYVMLLTAALAVCVLLGCALTRVLLRGKTSGRKLKTVVLTLVFSLVLLMAAGLCYLEVYYRADDEAKTALISGGGVTVSEIGGGVYFDGPGTRDALVFYPGAKVEAAAYAPLLRELAAEGLDCFLAEMPFRMAVLDVDAASRFTAAYPYENWYIGGHSLGGASAALKAASDPDLCKGLVLLAAYPTKPIGDGTWLCSVYGSEDGCLEEDVYEESKQYWPANAAETVIEGGNHAQFGCYGAQRGDGTASVSAEEQRRQTVQAVMAMVHAGK